MSSESRCTTYRKEVPNSDGVGTAEHLVGFPPPGQSAADIVREGKDAAQKLSSRGDVDDDDDHDGANDDRWF